MTFDEFDENGCLKCPCYHYCTLECCIRDKDVSDEVDLEELLLEGF